MNDVRGRFELQSSCELCLLGFLIRGPIERKKFHRSLFGPAGGVITIPNTLKQVLKQIVKL